MNVYGIKKNPNGGGSLEAISPEATFNIFATVDGEGNVTVDKTIEELVEVDLAGDKIMRIMFINANGEMNMLYFTGGNQYVMSFSSVVIDNAFQNGNSAGKAVWVAYDTSNNCWYWGENSLWTASK